jgi:hypothetical protein
MAPRHIVPGSAGFRFCGGASWLNRFLFPISRQRFLADLKRAGFAGNAQIVNPGDVIAIEGGGMRINRGGSPIAVTLQDDSEWLSFDPTAPVPELADPNPEGLSRAALEERILPFLAGFKAYAEGEGDAVIRLYRAQRARFALSVVFPEGPPLSVRFDFGDGLGREEAEADVVNRIAASALADWIACDKSFFYVRAHSRRHQSVYEIACEGGAVRLKRVLLPDLLMHYLLNLAPGSKTAARRLVDRQIAGLSPRPPS